MLLYFIASSSKFQNKSKPFAERFVLDYELESVNNG